jgi:hypothetical protein
LNLIDEIVSEPLPNLGSAIGTLRARLLTPAPKQHLAVLAALTGESETQDARIATVFLQPHPPRMLRRHINDILAGPWAMREVVQRLLLQIAERSKNETLTDAVRSIDPSVVSAPPALQAEPVPVSR